MRRFGKRLIFISCVLTLLQVVAAHAEILGDVDGDGQVDMTEAVYALQVQAGLKSPETIVPQTLVVATSFSSNLEGLGTIIHLVADQISELSSGRLLFDVYEPGVKSSPTEVHTAVSDGSEAQVGHTASTYLSNTLPAADLFSAFPFGPEATEFLAWIWYGNGLSLWQQLYDNAGLNVKVLVCGMLVPESGGWFKTEINSIQDLNGLKIRAFGLGALVWAKFGMTIVPLPGGQICAALGDGTVDAVEFSYPSIDEAIGLYNCGAPHNYFPGWHQKTTLMELVINKNVWNGLSQQHQNLIETVCKAATLDNLAKLESMQGASIAANQSPPRNITNHYWPQSILDAFEAAWSQVVTEKSVNADFAAIWSDFSTFHQNYSIWSQLGYLPSR